MEFDNSWDALLKPGEAAQFFDIHNAAPIQTNSSGYSKINAWWMAELSRLIYKQETDEIGKEAKVPTRKDILDKVNLDEIKFFNRGGTLHI